MSARSDGQKKRQDRALAAGQRAEQPRAPREHRYGVCPVCGYVRAVNADGTIGNHHWQRGQGRCSGSGQAPRKEEAVRV